MVKIVTKLTINTIFKEKKEEIKLFKYNINILYVTLNRKVLSLPLEIRTVSSNR